LRKWFPFNQADIHNGLIGGLTTLTLIAIFSIMGEEGWPTDINSTFLGLNTSIPAVMFGFIGGILVGRSRKSPGSGKSIIGSIAGGFLGCGAFALALFLLLIIAFAVEGIQ
jgi:hypothetical protein